MTTLRDPTGPLFSLIVVIIAGTTFYSLREALDLPVAPPQNVRLARRQQDKKQPVDSGPIRLFRRARQVVTSGSEAANFDDLDRPRRPLRVPNHSELPEWEPPKDDTGLIQLEID